MHQCSFHFVVTSFLSFHGSHLDHFSFHICPNTSLLHKCFSWNIIAGRQAAYGNYFQISPLAGPVSWPIQVNSESLEDEGKAQSNL